MTGLRDQRRRLARGLRLLRGPLLLEGLALLLRVGFLDGLVRHDALSLGLGRRGLCTSERCRRVPDGLTVRSLVRRALATPYRPPSTAHGPQLAGPQWRVDVERCDDGGGRPDQHHAGTADPDRHVRRAADPWDAEHENGRCGTTRMAVVRTTRTGQPRSSPSPANTEEVAA
jgi:hypothetical protein